MDLNTATTPVVIVTERAAEELKAMLGKPENAGKCFRLYVEEGGCSGMQYSMTFDQQRDKDALVQSAGVPVVVDPFSAEYLAGSVVDFSDSLTAGGFKISNPKARQSCGCGKSFTA
jgi:iron-sulfur cluster assembly protein